MRNSKVKKLKQLLREKGIEPNEVALQQLPTQKRVVFSKQGMQETHLTKLRVLNPLCGRKTYRKAKSKL